MVPVFFSDGIKWPVEAKPSHVKVVSDCSVAFETEEAELKSSAIEG
jgi:hypothetical protein